MSAATTTADGFAQQWDADGEWAWRTAPDVGTIELLAADGFPAAVNIRVSAPGRREAMVVLSDGFGQLRHVDLERVVDMAAATDMMVRASSLRVDCALVAIPGPLLVDLGGLHPKLGCFYWADELERHAGGRARRVEVDWVHVDDTRRHIQLRRRYHQAVADLGVLETGQRPCDG